MKKTILSVFVLSLLFALGCNQSTTRKTDIDEVYVKDACSYTIMVSTEDGKKGGYYLTTFYGKTPIIYKDVLPDKSNWIKWIDNTQEFDELLEIHLRSDAELMTQK